MTPDPEALAVLLDAARACYGDDSEQVRWLLNPGAVRELLSHTPGQIDDDSYCPSCGVGLYESHGVTAPRGHCPVAAAWRALGDPRGAADIERAHEEALREQANRILRASGYPGGFHAGGWVRERPMLLAPHDEVAVQLSPPSVLSPEEQLRLYGRVHCTWPPTRPGFPRPQGVHSAYCAYCATRLAHESQATSTVTRAEARVSLDDWRSASPVRAESESLGSTPCRHAVVIQRYAQHVVDGQRGLLGPTMEVVVESVCRACGAVIGGDPRDWAQIHVYVRTRVDSDARGMEAVEDEARRAEHTGYATQAWLRGETCGKHTGIASNRCLRDADHPGACDCQTVS